MIKGKSQKAKSKIKSKMQKVGFLVLLSLAK